MNEPVRRGLDAAWLVVVGLLPLVVWPPVETPFSSPKLVLLSAAALIGLLRAATAHDSGTHLSAIAATGLWALTLVPGWISGPFATGTALWLELGGALLLLALLLRRPPPQTLAVLALSGGGVAAVTLLQALGADPFGWFGLRGDHPGERMRVYGTLGNPDFVAAFLGATLWLSVRELWSGGAAKLRAARPRGVLWISVATVHLAALIATRSFGTIAALAGSGIFIALSLRDRRRYAVLTAVAVVSAVALFTLSSQRSLGGVIEGRLYLWRIAGAHLAQAPLLGHGRGSFETLWLAWEAEAWAAPAPELDRRFAGIQDHVHNDYLEWALELGVVGALLRMAGLLATLGFARRAATADTLCAGAALASLAVRAVFDFPISRPAELCVAAVLAGWIWGNRR